MKKHIKQTRQSSTKKVNVNKSEEIHSQEHKFASNTAYNSSNLTSEDILYLQRTVGNQMVQKMLTHKQSESDTNANVEKQSLNPIEQITVQDSIYDEANHLVQRFDLGGLWDSIADMGSSVWGMVTGQSDEEKKPSGTPGGDNTDNYAVPPGTFIVSDPNSIIRRPPPNLSSESNKPIIPEGTSVTVVEAYRKNGKYYVKVDFSEGTAWTSAGNMDGLSAQLTALNPKASEPQKTTIPKSLSDGILGLPNKPELDSPDFAFIVTEIETMENNPLAIETKHREEIGDDRKERIEKIGDLRDRIVKLTDTLSDDQVKQAKAYLYRRLAPLVPYSSQMANTNMLGRSGNKGWYRTCNVTAPAMVIEGLGKTKDDYIHSDQLVLLRKTFDALEDKYKERSQYEAVTDFDTLRMPDFMAVVAIAKHLPSGADSLPDESFVKAVSDARETAQKETTHHSTITWLIEQFGGTYKSHRVHNSELKDIGEAQRDYTKAQLRGENPEDWRDLYNDVESGKKDFESLNKKDKKRYKTLWKYEKFDKEKADVALSANTYRDAVLKKVNPMLDDGKQVLVGLENHFVRLQSLDETGVHVDDPGSRGFKDLRVTWTQARNMGYFKTFWSAQ